MIEPPYVLALHHLDGDTAFAVRSSATAEDQTTSGGDAKTSGTRERWVSSSWMLIPSPREPGHGPQRLCLNIMSTSSSYICSASSLPDLMACVAQCFRWFRISSRPTERSASCTDEICVMMSAQ